MQTIWLTGLSQSGKSTLASALIEALKNSGLKTQLLDGDQVRSVSATGFDSSSIKLHLQRLALTANLLNKQGVYVVVSTISPLEEVRISCRTIITPERFSLVFVDTPAEICQQIDSKNIWRSAFAGQITNFAGVSAPYEKPDYNLSYVFHSPWPRKNQETAIEIVDWVLKHRRRPAALFIGRWQPLHLGHVNIINRALEQGKRVVVGIRQVPVNEQNPLPTEVVEELLWAKFNNQIEIILLPNIESVNIGREVGYAVNTVEVDDALKAISATSIRESIRAGSDYWRSQVPAETVPIIERHRGHFTRSA